MNKFDRVFVPHPNFRFPTEPLYRIANEIVYVCDTPMFDDMIEGHDDKFEGRVAEKLLDFNPKDDIIAFYGDAVIFAMMVSFIASRHDWFSIARYSTKRDEYMVRAIELSVLDDYANE